MRPRLRSVGLPFAGGTAGNTRLTSIAGVLLLAFLVLQVVSALWFILLSVNVALPAGPIFDVVRPVHFFVGFLLLPVIGVKLASVGYRFTRYYLRDYAYKLAGAPDWLARLTAPVMLLAVVVLFGSGVEMWSFRNDLIGYWTQVHVLSAAVFVAALVVHLLIHARDAHVAAAADLVAPQGSPDHVEGRLSRRAFLGGGVAAGLVLAVSASDWPATSLSWLYPRKVGEGPLEFPTMNYEGGGQTVDLGRWRLRVTGAVSRPLELDYAQLAALPTTEHRYALNCVTGWTATRSWRGVPVVDLLRMAGTHPDFGHVLFRSTSGYHWSHQRSNVLLAGALIVTHVDGVPLNDDHGFPARLLIPGLQGQSNVKWLDELRVGPGPAERYVAPNLVPRSQPVTGPLLPADPAGRR
jgi:Oxidoreductase molybdopterin binding domain